VALHRGTAILRQLLQPTPHALDISRLALQRGLDEARLVGQRAVRGHLTRGGQRVDVSAEQAERQLSRARGQQCGGGQRVEAQAHVAALALERQRAHRVLADLLGGVGVGRVAQRALRVVESLARPPVSGRLARVAQRAIALGAVPTHLCLLRAHGDLRPLGRLGVALEELLPVRQRLPALQRQGVLPVDVDGVAHQRLPQPVGSQRGIQDGAAGGLGDRVEQARERGQVGVADARVG
jgi:hypothetical protein